MNKETVNIGGIKVGDDYPTAFMAELGTFYNQDIDKAINFVDLAVEAGSHIIKTEILHDPNVCLEKANLMHTYKHANGSTTENYRKLIERKTVPLKNYEKIFKYVKQKKVPLVASVYDFKGVDFLVENGGDAIKLWRNNYNNFPLIIYSAKKGLPIIFDIVNVYLDEIAKAVRIALSNGANGVIINYHPGINPASPEEHNLKIIKTYKKYFNIPVGLSCHYKGDEILYVAIGMGVNIIEKGVFDNPDAEEQNVISAADFKELNEIIEKVSNCWTALGKPFIDIQEPRDKTLQYGLVSRKIINKGDSLTIDNVRFSFPILGISVENWDSVQGKKSKHDIKENSEINWKDIEF